MAGFRVRPSSQGAINPRRGGGLRPFVVGLKMEALMEGKNVTAR
jgi:hypothetical protein